MKKLVIIFAISLSIIACNDKYVKIDREDKTSAVYVNDSDGEMNNAMENANESLDLFQIALQSKNPNYSEFKLKQYIETDEGGEHIWIGDILFKNGKYTGIVQNDPIGTTKIKFGDDVEIPVENVTDWMYYDGDTIRGAFTVKVLRKNMSAEDRKATDPAGMIYEK